MIGARPGPRVAPELLRRLPNLDPSGADLAARVVRDLGFVAGRSQGCNAAIRLRLPLVSEVALAAAFYWLADHNPRRVLIDFTGERRPAEVCTCAGAAIARLIELTRQHNHRVSVPGKQHSVDRLASTVVAVR